MDKRGFHRILSGLLVLAMLLSMVPAVFAADTFTDPINNGSFEEPADPSDWTKPKVWTLTGGVQMKWADSGLPDGKYYLGAYGTTGTASQTVSLGPGVYKFMVYSVGNWNTSGYMYYTIAGDTAKHKQTLAITDWTWGKNIQIITLTETKSVTLGFSLTADANKTSGVDKVTLERVDNVPTGQGAVQNGTFENGTNGWLVGGTEGP